MWVTLGTSLSVCCADLCCVLLATAEAVTPARASGPFLPALWELVESGAAGAARETLEEANAHVHILGP